MVQDEQVVRRYLKHKREQDFRIIYQKHNDKLFRLAMHMLSYNQHWAKDAVQEMWIVALRKVDKFEWRSSLNTWLTSILLNILKRYYPKTAEEQKVSEEPYGEFNLDMQDIIKSVNTLSDGYKQVFVLHDIEGYKHQEIAELLDIKEGTSKSQLFQARILLRSKLSELKIRS
ncbi:sigma-70 family RNA polymerase sigma factor [Fulvivirga sp.]|uniref:RNA polymerase sigma factor n=1 Tax=Fulvivirga sp. TaxID=1931237 RepID=UPI0032F05555